MKTRILKQLILVLDYYHAMEANSIHNVLTYLLDHIPEQMHLIIAERSDPPFPQARLRACGKLMELLGLVLSLLLTMNIPILAAWL
jgi:LuxR family maltose regulon positive regulatory protein